MSANGKTDTLTPRQQLFKQYYLDPESETFSNAYQSAIKAGFEDKYGKNITGQGTDWVSEIIRDHEMLNQAEKNLKEFLVLSNPEAPFVKIKSDITKFVAERLGKRKWSERTELTGEGGGPILGYVYSGDVEEEKE